MNPSFEDARSLVRQDRVLRAVSRIAKFRRGLERALQEVDDEEDWVHRWLAPDQEEDIVLAALERQYERIVNAWQDEVFDVLEAEAVARGLAPEPPIPLDATDAMRRLVASRQLFAHRYTRADDELHGRDVWRDVQSLRTHMPQVSADVQSAIERLWPPDDPAGG